MKVSTVVLTVGTAYAASHGADNCGHKDVTTSGISHKLDYTKKATLTNKFCSYAPAPHVSVATCQPFCCDIDATKCGAKNPNCAAGTFRDYSKYQNARGADDAAAKTNCCTTAAKCSTITCPAGKVKDDSKKDNYCAGATCSSVNTLDIDNVPDYKNCCKDDTTKCYSKRSSGCGDNALFMDKSKQGRDILFSSHRDTVKDSCCTAKGKCTGFIFRCNAGTKLKTATTYCGNKATCNSKTDQGTCCEADTTKCGGSVVTCGTGKFQDASKAGTDKGTDAVAACCGTKATCAASVCLAGMKLKSGTNYCAGATCVTKTDKVTGDTAACCENDTTKCLGATVTCDATKGQYKDEKKNGNTAGADAAAKTANCCSTGSTCDAFIKADLSVEGTTGSTSAAWQPKGQVMQVVVALATVLSVKQFWL